MKSLLYALVVFLAVLPLSNLTAQTTQPAQEETQVQKRPHAPVQVHVESSYSFSGQ